MYKTIHVIICMVKSMYTINKNVKNEIIIKNSRFITVIIKIRTKEEVEKYLNEIKRTYPKATHYCYAYKIGESIKKATDDGEPQGTAGMPILNVLDKENITNVIAIVIRYFGGIKLGASGLIRAYSKSVRDALNNTEINELIKAATYDITFPYTKEKEINKEIKEENIQNKTYLEAITYRVILPDNSPILNRFPNIKIEESYIEKKKNKKESKNFLHII